MKYPNRIAHATRAGRYREILFMRDLEQVLGCFPSILDWRDAYLNDGRQRILGDAPEFFRGDHSRVVT